MNQQGELIAILTAIKSIPKGDKLEIISDSKYSIKGIIEGIPKWTDEGWINVENKEIVQRIAYTLDTRGTKTTLKWIKGHSGDEGNEYTDKKAEEGANKEKEDTIDLKVPKDYELEGAKLNKLTQKLAYMHVQEQKQIKALTPTGEKNMEETRKQIEEMLGVYPSEKAIWNGLKETTIRRNITDFMWKQLHGTLKIGNYWLRIPSHKEKAYCKECQNLETLNHILFECQIEGREEIWDMAEKLWN